MDEENGRRDLKCSIHLRCVLGALSAKTAPKKMSVMVVVMENASSDVYISKSLHSNAVDRMPANITMKQTKEINYSKIAYSDPFLIQMFFQLIFLQRNTRHSGNNTLLRPLLPNDEASDPSVEE